MKRIFLCIIFLTCYGLGYSQPVLTNYIERGNKIIFDLELNPVSLLKTDQKNKSVIQIGYFDESLPGEIPLPRRSVFIGIPPNAKISLNCTIIKENSIQGIPGINPEVKVVNDSVLFYNFFPTKFSKSVNKPGIRVKGYLWVNDIYAAHLEIDQYSFDYSKVQLLELDKVHVELTLTKNIEFQGNTSATDKHLLSKTVLLNYQEARKFSVTNPHILQNDTSDNWIDYSESYVKLKLAQDGIYRVSYNDMLETGANVSEIDPLTFNIYNKGHKIPVFINGEDDHSFDPGDYIEFVGRRNMGNNYRDVSLPGEPYNVYDGRYTDSSSYWITWNDEPRLRVSEVNNSSTVVSTDTLKYYNDIAHNEKNVFIDNPTSDLVKAQLPFWLENKFWGWFAFGVGTRVNTVNINNIYPDQTAELFAKVISYASDDAANSHLLSLSLSNQTTGYDTVSLNRYEQKLLSTSINSNLLAEGNNDILLNSYATNSVHNGVYLDWYEIEYPRYLSISNDSLIFSFNYLQSVNTYNCKLINAAGSNYSIWKEGTEYEKYNDFSLQNNIIVIKDTISSEDTFFVFTDNSIKHPLVGKVKHFVNLRSSDNKADYITLTNTEFLQKADEYDQFIEQEYSVTTKLVDINDIYDEFSYGYFNPESIKDFFQSTFNYWQQPLPKYVFIIGDANYDYYNWKHIYTGTPLIKDVVPSFGEPVSDNWFVTWDTTGAYIPQMNIGRLPIHTPPELDNYLQRHQQYISQPYNEWNKSYLFFSGGLGNETELTILRETNQAVIDNYIEPAPIGGNYYHFYKTLDPITNFGPYSNQYVQNAIDQGSLFISYLGHSGTQTWDNSIADPSQLHNSRNRFPMITDFGCSTAKFAEPEIVSFSELFLTSSSGQAISYIGNSSLGFSSTSTTFPGIFYKKILQDSVLNISEAHKLAKLELLQDFGSSGTYKVFALTNELIGDPILSLPIPQKPNLEIDGNGTKVLTENISDLTDSAAILFKFYNWGKVIPDSFLLVLQDNYLGNIIAIDSVYKTLPRYEDSLKISFPVSNKPGEHSVTISLDANNKIDEITEADNLFTLQFYVASSRIRTLLSYDIENGLNNSLLIINPSVKPSSDSLVIEIAENNEYANSTFFYSKMDSVRTYFNFPIDYLNKRIWFRGKINGDSFTGFDKSGFTGIIYNYYLGDSESFSTPVFMHLINKNNIITLDTNRTDFRVISAGFNDGKTAVIEKNGENFVPIGNVIGHHICVFKDSTYEFLEYRLFDVFNNPEDRTAYAAFLDSLGTDVILLVAISDEGRVDNTLKQKLHEFGSIYIDSLVFRSSWAFIGKRGAVPGSMPEAYSKPFEGRVEVDTLIQKLFTSGTLTTSKIGPAAKWESVIIDQSVPASAETNIRPIGIKTNAAQDTLGFLTVENGVADISNISALTYPDIKLLVGMQTNDASQVPSISSIAVNYKALSELGTNYQAASVDKDSLNVGDNTTLHFDVYNVGDFPADSFTVTVEVVKSDNSRETVQDDFVNRLDASGKKSFAVTYNTLGLSGTNQFYIKIDPDNKISELYKDNNVFTIPFYVKGDSSKPTVNLTFDGNQIFDGDFVSSDPVIKIELNDPSYLPITDTTALTIQINDKTLYYSDNENLTYQFNAANPKMVAEYRPHLPDGDYSINILAKNASGNFNDSAGVTRIFTVLSDTRLLYVYNYPNPFSGETYFTFKLTQVPDELKINIYTVAGRLVKVIQKNPSELNTDFNRIYWDGKDEDGDRLANGVYFYKMYIKKDDKTESVTQKLAIVR